ncbi:uncharacterized protein LOC121054290 [Oryza brachyantha]|uniref:uncharacterized protein LOC121054290 n=1 Tax=Oryza brachyantha TaxID=4533 RepID=UPI001AD95E2F|nr:uncharacterized protein LOC121054290 [Oryza brachyantha]
MDVAVDVEMERPPAAEAQAQAQRPRPNPVVERKLGELNTCLADAMSSRPRRRDVVDGSLFAEIQARADFLRNLIAAERECHGGALPDHLAEAEARFAVLKGAFDQWARRGDAAPAEEEQPSEAAGSGSGSECSCTESCCGVEVTGGRGATSDVERGAVETTVGGTFSDERKPGHKPAPAAATRSATRRRGWRWSAACCGAAGAVAVVALAVGVAIEFALVAHHSVYVVPT